MHDTLSLTLEAPTLGWSSGKPAAMPTPPAGYCPPTVELIADPGRNIDVESDTIEGAVSHLNAKLTQCVQMRAYSTPVGNDDLDTLECFWTCMKDEKDADNVRRQKPDGYGWSAWKPAR